VVAVAVGVVTLAIGMVEVPMDSLSHAAGTGGALVDTLTTAVGVVPATAVATLLAARRPGNPIGWLLLAILVVGFNPAASTSSWTIACTTGRCPGLGRGRAPGVLAAIPGVHRDPAVDLPGRAAAVGPVAPLVGGSGHRRHDGAGPGRSRRGRRSA
jgi:hypothetical protein